MLRALLLAAGASDGLERLVSRAPGTRSVVDRFVPGTDLDDAVRVTRSLIGDGLRVSIDRLGEDTTDAAAAIGTADAYCVLLSRLAGEGLTPAAEVSVKPTALGSGVSAQLGREQVERVVAAAEAAGTTVTLDMEDSGTTDATLELLAQVRATHPATGAVIQSYLRRSEADCRALASAGARVRLCKGAYAEPPAVAYPDRADVDASYVRCLRVLMVGSGYPMVATHDPRLIRIAGALADKAGRGPEEFEYQMLYGIRPAEQRRLAAGGATVRVYLPYGSDWYGYFMRRLAERPANLAFFLRSLATRS